jgi:hypothetical protein
MNCSGASTDIALTSVIDESTNLRIYEFTNLRIYGLAVFASPLAPGVLSRRELRLVEDRPQLPRFLQKRVELCAAADVRRFNHFQPVETFVCFLHHEPQFRREVRMGTSPAGRPVVGADSSPCSKQLVRKLASFPRRPNRAAESNNTKTERERPPLQGFRLWIHAARPCIRGAARNRSEYHGRPSGVRTLCISLEDEMWEVLRYSIRKFVNS